MGHTGQGERKAYAANEIKLPPQKCSVLKESHCERIVCFKLKLKLKKSKKRPVEVKLPWKHQLQKLCVTCIALQQSTYLGLECHRKAERKIVGLVGWRGWGDVGKPELLMCERGNATVNVHLSTLRRGKMQAIFLDRFPFKAGAPRGCKNRVGERRGRLGVEGWRVTPAPFQTVQQKLAGSAWLNPSHCEVKPMEELILGFWEYVMHWLYVEVSLLCAFDEKSLVN